MHKTRDQLLTELTQQAQLMGLYDMDEPLHISWNETRVNKDTWQLDLVRVKDIVKPFPGFISLYIDSPYYKYLDIKKMFSSHPEDKLTGTVLEFKTQHYEDGERISWLDAEDRKWVALNLNKDYGCANIIPLKWSYRIDLYNHPNPKDGHEVDWKETIFKNKDESDG